MLDTLDLPMSRKQLGSLATSDGTVNVWDGSIRSGKTVASLLRWLMFIAVAPRGGELVMIGRTRESIGRNLFGPLQDPSLFGALTTQVQYTTGAPTARILGRTIHVIGASDAKSEPVIRGLTVAGAYVDEITVIPEAFFTQLLGRMSVQGAKLMGTTNPDSPAHWLKAKFLDKHAQGKLPHWRYWHFNMRDNPALTAEYIAQKEVEFTGLWYRRFVLGEWVAAEGAIYGMWDPDRHVVPWSSLPDMVRLLGCGIDYGTTNATSAVLLGVGVDRRLYLIDEFRHDPRAGAPRLTDGELSAQLRAWLDRPHLPTQPGMRPEWLYVDPSAASLRLQLFRDGISPAVANNKVGFGLGLVATLLAEGQLLTSDRCTGWISEAPAYSWDPAKTEKGLDEPLKVADHSADAVRYVVASTENQWRSYLPALAA
jgi:hypothetical protein